MLELQREVLLATLDKKLWFDMSQVLDSLVRETDGETPPLENASLFRRLKDAIKIMYTDAIYKIERDDGEMSYFDFYQNMQESKLW